MGQKKVLVKINPEGKYVVDIDKDIDINDLKPNTRVALRNDSYTLHKILPTKVDPLVSLMKVEAVPDSTYDMIGGLEKQVMEIKEVIDSVESHDSMDPWDRTKVKRLREEVRILKRQVEDLIANRTPGVGEANLRLAEVI
jgi:hypothetical protein